MLEKIETKKIALSARAIEKMKAGDKDKTDVGEYSGLRVGCGKTGVKSFKYRYRSPIDNSLKTITLGHYPALSLAEARVELQKLKLLRAQGVCPITQRKNSKVEEKIRQVVAAEVLSVKNVVDLYLENVIEDKHILDEQSNKKKIVKGSRAIKGQIEARRTLYVDVVSSISEKAAVEITRKDVVSLIKGIIDRGAQVQAGKVLSELTAAYEYCIGLDYFPDTFANPGLLAKSSLKQTRIKLNANKRQRVLSEIELKAVLQWLSQVRFLETS